MKTVKVAEATERQLDWLVARIEGDELPKSGGKGLDYSSDWEAGGPIIERECIAVLPPMTRRIGAERHAFPVDYWRAMLQRDENESATHGRGPTPLIAAMRCYVASRLGDTAEVPEELT